MSKGNNSGYKRISGGGGQEITGCHYNMPQDSYLMGHFNITLLLVLEYLICIGYIPRCRSLRYLYN